MARRRISQRRAGEQLAERIGITATSAIDTIWEQIRGEVLREYQRLQRQGLDLDEIVAAIEVFIADLSRAGVADAARTSSRVSYNQGRRVGQLRLIDEAPRVVRSERLESATICDPCVSLDGTVVEVGTEEWERMHPPAGCDGRDRCRGVYLPIVEGLV